MVTCTLPLRLNHQKRAAAKLEVAMSMEMSVEKYTNEYGKECYRGVTELTPFPDLEFHYVPDTCKSHDEYDRDEQYALHTNLGTLTVLDRRTGYGWRDTETGLRTLDGKFWLASGNLDVRESNAKTLGEAISWVKANANNCKGE